MEAAPIGGVLATGICRAGDAARSPVEELEVALDAMHNMQAPFCGRYTLGSAIDRRSGGQGVVQFADIAGTRDRVRCPWSSQICD